MRQFIELKEKMANAMNDALGGKAGSGGKVFISMSEEGSDLD